MLAKDRDNRPNNHNGAIPAVPTSVKAFEDCLIQQLRERREKLGLTQVKLQELIGVADNLVAKWEVGMRKPSGFLLFCWADALGCKLKLVEKSECSDSIQS